MPSAGSVKDEGYSWLVMVAVCFSHYINGASTFGVISVLTYVWTNTFSITTEVSAWAASVMSASYFLLSPCLSLLIRFLGTWKTQLVGVILSITGSLVTSFATQFWHVIVGFSIIQTLGFAITLLASYDIIHVYFDRHRDKISSAASLLYCSGIVTGPVLTEYLIQTITFKHTSLCVTGFCILNIPSAFIYKRFTCCGNEASIQVTEKDENELTSPLNAYIVEGDAGKDIKPIEKGFSGSRDRYEAKSENEENNNLAGILSVAETDGESKQNRKPRNFNAKICGTLRQHLNILKQPLFGLLLLCLLLAGMGGQVFYSLAVDYMVTKGVLPLRAAAIGMTLTGASTVAGSLSMTLLSHWKPDRIILLVVAVTLNGHGIMLFPLANGMAVAYTIMVLFGLGDSILMTNMIPMLAQVFPGSDKEVTIRFSYIFLFYGLGAISGPPIATKIASVVNVDSGFYFAGGCNLLSAVVLFLYWVVHKIQCLRTKSWTLNQP